MPKANLAEGSPREQVSINARAVATYLAVAVALFVCVRHHYWSNWSRVAAQWYLLEPPATGSLSSGSFSTDAGAPVRQWWISEAYPSRQECLKGKARRGSYAPNEKCLPASNLAIQHTDEWRSLVPPERWSLEHPSHVFSNLFRNLPSDLVNIGRSLLLDPVDNGLTVAFFFAIAYGIWRGMGYGISAAVRRDYGQLSQFAAVVMAISVMAFLLLDLAWYWAALFVFAFLLYRHSEREDNRARHGDWRECLKSTTWDAAEGVYNLGIVYIAFWAFAIFVVLLSGKFHQAFSLWTLWALIIAVACWVGRKHFHFFPAQERIQEIGSPAWKRKHPEIWSLAISLDLGEPPWADEQIRQVRQLLEAEQLFRGVPYEILGYAAREILTRESTSKSTPESEE